MTAPAGPGPREAVPRLEETDALFDALIDPEMAPRLTPEPTLAEVAVQAEGEADDDTGTGRIAFPVETEPVAPPDADETQRRSAITDVDAVAAAAPVHEEEEAFDQEATVIYNANASPDFLSARLAAYRGTSTAPEPPGEPPTPPGLPVLPAETAEEQAPEPYDEAPARESAEMPLSIELDAKGGFVFTDEDVEAEAPPLQEEGDALDPTPALAEPYAAAAELQVETSTAEVDFESETFELAPPAEASPMADAAIAFASDGADEPMEAEGQASEVAEFDDAVVAAEHEDEAAIAADFEGVETAVYEEQAADFDLSGVSDDMGVAEGEPSGAVPLPEGDAVDAVVTLMQRGARDAWVARASWLYAEAPDASNGTERARALLLVSELFAMAGEDMEAERVVREALELSPSSPLARRQLRNILTARGDWSSALEELDAEARVAPNPAAQAQSAYVGAEVARLIHEDRDGCVHRLEQVRRASPGDVRPLVYKLASGLAIGDDVPRLPWPDELSVEPLVQASRVLAGLRGVPDAGDGTPYLRLLRVRSAIRRHDLGSTLDAFSELERQGGGVAAAWLVAALARPQREARARAMDALRRAVDGTHPALAQRLLASAAVEAGDTTAARDLLSYAAPEALTAADRLALSGLLGTAKSAADGQVWLDEIVEVPEHGALASAWASAVGDPSDPARRLFEIGSEPARAAAMLGRFLATEALEGPRPHGGEEVVPTVEDAARRLQQVDPISGEAKAVMLELAYRSGDPAEIAALLVASAEQVPGLERECALAEAMLAELDGNRHRKAEALERARQAAPDFPAATRLGIELADAPTAADHLAALADALDDRLPAALAYTEAATRLIDAGLGADAEPLLQRAVELAPELPVASFLGLMQALRNGDADGQRAWLQQRRRAEQGDAVADAIREAMQLDESQQAERAALLADAHRERPDDYGLRELYETALGGTADDRPAWLVARAAALPEVEGAPLALEAALHFELSGDLEQAAAAAFRAASDPAEPLAPIVVERLALEGYGADELVASLAERASQASTVADRRELHERLAELELRGRRDGPGALSWLQQILLDVPDDLPTLHRIERILIAARAATALEPVALAVAQAIDGPDAAAHAMLAARLRYRAGAWDEAAIPVQLAHAHQPTSVWALRHMAAHAIVTKNHAVEADVHVRLAELSSRALEQATLLLRASEAYAGAGDDIVAADLLGQALERWPDHYLARLERASMLERGADPAAAAAAYEELAQIALAPHARCAHLYKAASLWLSVTTHEAQAEGQRLLEAVTSIDAAYADAFDRLKAIYLATDAKADLAELLGARLATIDDPAERVQMEVLRGRMLVESGSAAEAKASLAAALELSPDNPEALSAYADVCAAEADWEGVEQALIQLARLVADPARQASIYMRLGALYDGELPTPERAELAYLEALKHAPEEAAPREALCDLYLREGVPQKAFEQQEALIEASKSSTIKCARTVRLAEIHEIAGDHKEAEATLQKARRSWPKEPSPVGALYQLYRRSGQDAQADQLIERAAADVRRGLGAGRFEAPLFRLAAMVAELRGEHDAARVTEATLAALEGDQPIVGGVGLTAARPELDRYLAPEPFGPAFRTLLQASGSLLDEAVPLDMKSLRTKPLAPPQQYVADEVLRIAAAYGIPELSIQVSNAIGHVCMPASEEPPTLILGAALVASEDPAAREFLLHRGLKVLQAGTAALSRTAPIDLWPLVAAYLRIHLAGYAPQGVDMAKVNDYHARMARKAPRAFEPAVVACAQEVADTIGNRASSLNHVSNSWGARAALLAMGDPLVAMRALAWGTGGVALPTAAADRLRWIGRQAEARDIIVFSVSEDYIAARAACGGEVAPAAPSVPALPREVYEMVEPAEVVAEADIEFDDEDS